MGVIVLISAAATLGLDQASKAVALRRTNPILNARTALFASSRVAIALFALISAYVVVLVLLGLANERPPVATGLGLSIGGAAGNLVDRLRTGGVVDFISLGRWPTFNLADAALVAGVALVGIALV